MNRKLDSSYNAILYSAPPVWKELQKKDVIKKDGSHAVSLELVSSEDLQKQNCDPSQFNLDFVLETGLIEPMKAQQANIFGLTDPASIDSRVSELSEDAFKVVTESPNYDLESNTLIPDSNES